jgi:hypothetical protein
MRDHEHPVPTKNHRYRYLFTVKHHGGQKGAAQWILPESDEFAVFVWADEWEVSDKNGNLFGGLREGMDSLRYLGTLAEQIAKFPLASEGSPWHGYPVWPVDDEQERPAKEVFKKMVEAGLIMEELRRRLMGGHHV